MNKFILSSLILMATLSSQAQTFKVVKIQGKKAIVEVADPSTITVNQSYTVGGGASSGDAGGSISNGKNMNTGHRAYGIAGSLEFSSLKADTAGAQATDTLALAGTFLWNMKQYEAGPTLGYSSSKVAGNSTTTMIFGGTGYYNFQENKPGVDQIMSVVGNLLMTSVTPAAGSSYTGTLIEVGGSYRTFLLSTDHCLELRGLYSMDKSKVGTVDVTTSGFKILGGISTYF